MILRVIKTQIVLLLYIVNVDLTDTADIENDVFFGPNGVYKCHCASGCNTNGTCSNNGPCSKGWFGLKCQYQDLATIDGTNVQPPAAEKLTDRNDTTCLQNNQQTVNVTFNTTYVFTWMRIVVNNESMLSNFTFQFTTRSSGSDVLDCERKRFFLINSKTLDIKCYFTRIIEKVYIGGPGVASLCSLYINGGRNVALKQVTWQSSNFSIENFVYDASKAVDGDTSGNFSKNSCSHTHVPDSTPTWSVRFKSSEITRYIIYNRASYQERLHGFTLEAKGEGGGKFTYKDNSTSMVYTVLDSLKHNITNVTIDVKEYTFPILTLCEVEIYGECQSGTWDLECKNCSASCSGTCHIDDGSCNMVCFGFKDPPDCLQACDKGYYGVNCKQKCPNNCDVCHATYGQCYRCQPGFQGKNCTVCTNSQWGENCVNNCSNNCQNKSCDKVNGTCHGGCIAGFQPPDCIQVCPDGQWGVNCNMTCSKGCKDKLCDKTNGHCSNGCSAGFLPPDCVHSCNDFQYEYCSYYFQNKTCDKANGFCLDQGRTSNEENSSCTDFDVGFGAGLATGLGVFIISLVILYIWYKRRVLSLHKQYQQQQCYSQLEISQVEKHVYAKVYDTVAEKDLHSTM